MLKLKKLQILGFKSFCDRTELRFPGDGIAAIVGPNGCGKSNVSDAITWVLGEQSAKSLRGLHMQDVIFAGTRDRKPTGMAEVSLTLIDPAAYDGELSGEPEIEIRDEFTADDWDEAALREKLAAETEHAVEEAQPGIVLNENEATPEEIAAAQIAKETVDADTQSAAPQTEVVLKIRRRKFHHKQFRAGEVVITRRLFRSGESEYLLNGKLCRLRDIQDIFMGTGLGPESYAIIEQGRIGQILSSKPHDRRAILEEAAGITKFKTKKRLAEARLEQAKQNLARVNDIFDEVTRQMRSLQRQASKAERFAKLRDEMRAKLRVVMASKSHQMSSSLAEADSEFEKLNATLTELSHSLNSLQSGHGAATARQQEFADQLAAAAQQAANLTLSIDRCTVQIKNNEERAVELETRAAHASSEMKTLTGQLKGLRQEHEGNAQLLQSAASDVEAARSEAAQKQQEAIQANRSVSELERRIDEFRSQLMAEVNNAARIRSQIVQAEEQCAALDRDRQRVEGDIARAISDIEAFGGKRGQLDMEFESVSDRMNNLAKRIGETRTLLEAKRQDEIGAKRHADGLRAELATALGKRNSLETIIREHGYSTESVKRLLKSNQFQEGMTPVGVLADFLEVDDQYEAVVDDFLRDELNYIVVKSWDAASEGVRLLKTGVDGRATFLVHPSDAQARFPFTIDEQRSRPGQDRVVPLTSAMKVLNGFGRSLEVILPKLRDGYITPDADVARSLALENPDAYFLAPSGETFHNVTVTGGKKAGEGPLALKRELRAVQKQCVELELALQKESAQVLLLAKEIAELSHLLETLQEEKREAERVVMTSSHALQQLKQEMDRTEQRLGQLRLEADRISRSRSEKQDWIAARKSEVESVEANRERLDQQIQMAQTGLAELKQQRDACAQAASEVNARVAGMEERRRSAAATMARIETQLAEAGKRAQALQHQIASASQERETRIRDNEQLATTLSTATQERESLQGRIATMTAEAAQIRELVTNLDAILTHERARVDTLRDQRGEVSARSATLRSDLAHLAETCINELSLQLDELHADSDIALLEGAALAEADQEHKDLRAKLDAMGPVNMMALDEYKETSERHQFLETQRLDLMQSIENTLESIKEIDQVSREKFEEAFHKVNENFQVTFRKLFGGGQGFLRLTDPENVNESGIDIIASPPGKKLQNVLLLSGGEKALTALSLLVGIFQHVPSPFCILDEVDAPLDDTNVGRFVELIREMSAQTQFIVITHHKRTMAAAPVMYGVTMQEPGVSKVVGVHFGADQKQAASA